MAKTFNEPKSVLVFNGSRVLIAIIRSLHSAAQLSGGNLQAISFCCSGRYISTGGFYFRHLHPDVELEKSDMNTLKLDEYDKLCGEHERRYHSKKDMAKRLQQTTGKRKNNDNNKK